MFRKAFVKSFGCQMNVYDSERMAELLANEGYARAQSAEEADLILLNTCHIREKAAEKLYSELGRLKALKRNNPKLTIGVAGCVAQAEGAEILARAPVVDLVVGPQAYHRLPELLRKVDEGVRPVETEFPSEDKFAHLPRRRAGRGPTAFLTVQEGCDKFCTFCVVPYTRGAEVSRPVDQILAEAQSLVATGVREITLLGQNVNAYRGLGPDGQVWSLARLLDALAKLEGLERLRYTTSHPLDMTDDLIAAHATNEKVMPFLHLPVQSGSDRVLKAMNRRHRAEDYLRVVERLRAARPDIALSSDFIVGFPGETEADFQATLDLVEAVGFAQAFSFKYSPRPGTPAAERPQVPAEIASERLSRLQALLARQQNQAQEAMVGRTVSVLFEKPGREAGQMTGRSEHGMAVHVSAPVEVGALRRVRIEAAFPHSLAGSLT